MTLNKNLIAEFNSAADERSSIVEDGYRITVLTERLVRLERGRNRHFCDGATQTVWFRNFPYVPYTVEDLGGSYVIRTAISEFVFLKKSRVFVKITVNGQELSTFDKGNLKGTCRTVDMRNGAVALCDGVISRTGVAYLSDKSMALGTDGKVKGRTVDSDVYVFAYGHDYRAALRDFYYLCGKVPMMPRYVLGNWWSRYRAYTQEEYLSVIDKFADKKVPLSVATIDMDWHWVKVDKKFGEKFPTKRPWLGSGWTGYSWNTDLFPDYKEFLDTLHKDNLRVTLNLHPADGVRWFEDSYEDMAKAVGIDPKTKQTVKFDLSDDNFINAYFDILHHGYEKDGVNFWWIDWQQGKKSTVKGLDPLWALNHLHYLDNCRDGKRGVILSRFAGAGSHRYPLGFSGDSVATWKSLKFQPYMTSTAGNVGYGWWSHDIGGHTFGIYDDELYLRWCQLGVFSPVNRLHSTAHDLQGKEPWRHCETVEKITEDFLRLRHRLVPYIYTAMKNASDYGVSLCEPPYYNYPDEDGAYRVKNEYFFGSELLVCPVTSKRLKSLNMSRTDVWVPEGRYTDFFTGRIYKGGRIISMFRDLENIPVLCKEGAIIPLADDGVINGCDNPVKFEVLIYRGNNAYSLYEDDGESNDYLDGEYAYTDFAVSEEDGKITFTVSAPRYGKENGKFALPENRTYYLTFKDISGGKVKINGVPCDGDIIVKNGDAVEITDYEVARNPEPFDETKRILSRVQGNTLMRMIKYFGMGKITDKKLYLDKIRRRFGKNVYLAAKEVSE